MTTARGKTSRLSNGPYMAVIAVALTSFFLLRSSHEFHYPTPWPDEGSFLWQAIGFAEHGTLFAPELNPTRHIMWMPPAYMILTGTIFALTGFSLFEARLLSAIFVVGTVLCICALLSRSRWRTGHVLVLLAFLLGPAFQLAANTARMEPLVLLVASVAFLLLARHSVLAGLAVACLAPLVHPNGVFPAIAAALLAIACFVKTEKRSIARWEWAVAAMVATSWLAYAGYIVRQWDDFLLDMSTQVAWKQAESALTGGVEERLTRLASAALVVAWLGVALGARRLARASLFDPRGRDWSLVCIMALAGGFVWQTLVTVGWMYDVYAAFAYALVIVVVIELSLRASTSLARGWVRAGAVAVAFAGGVLTSFLLANSEFLMRSVVSTTVIAPASRPRYYEPSDRRRLIPFLRRLARSNRPVTVQFVPEADALLYADARDGRLKFLQPTRYDGTADVYVFHDSVWIPPKVKELNIVRMAFQQGIPIPVAKWGVIHRRDGTESWRIYRQQ
jgi:hypothetical protein